MLRPDQLGAKGESRFQEICEDAKITCNRSQRDMTGWDFIVEFPFDANAAAGERIEKRAPPISCHVQVKTQYASEIQRISMRLSSAERLAKELKPSFVYVLIVGQRNEFVDAYLLHMLGDNLAAILKRLREAELKGDTSINKKQISINVRKLGERIPISGEALREALVRYCGTDPYMYVDQKRKQLQELGYDNDRHTVNIELTLEKKEDLVDVFLGLKKGSLTSSEHFETRFGLKKRLHGLSPGEKHEFAVKPLAIKTSTVIFRSPHVQQPAILTAEVFVPAIPGLPFEESKMLIESRHFRLLLSHGGINYTTKALPEDASLFLIDWIQSIRMYLILAIGQGTFKIQLDTTRSLTFPIEKAEATAERTEYESILSTLESAAALLAASGESDTPSAFYEIMTGSKSIHAAYDFFIKSRLETFECDVGMADISNPIEIEALFTSTFQIGTRKFGYYGRVNLTPVFRDGRTYWRSGEVKPVDIQRLNSYGEYQSFVDAAALTLKLESRCTMNPPDDE